MQLWPGCTERAVIIYGRGGGGILKIMWTQNLPPPRCSHGLHASPSKSVHFIYDFQMCVPSIFSSFSEAVSWKFAAPVTSSTAPQILGLLSTELWAVINPFIFPRILSVFNSNQLTEHVTPHSDNKNVEWTTDFHFHGTGGALKLPARTLGPSRFVSTT